MAHLFRLRYGVEAEFPKLVQSGISSGQEEIIFQEPLLWWMPAPGNASR